MNIILFNAKRRTGVQSSKMLNILANFVHLSLDCKIFRIFIFFQQCLITIYLYSLLIDNECLSMAQYTPNIIYMITCPFLSLVLVTAWHVSSFEISATCFMHVLVASMQLVHASASSSYVGANTCIYEPTLTNRQHRISKHLLHSN